MMQDNHIQMENLVQYKQNIKYDNLVEESSGISY